MSKGRGHQRASRRSSREIIVEVIRAVIWEVIAEVITEVITEVIRGRQGGHQAIDSPGPQSLETRSCRTSGATRWPRLQSAAASKYLMRKAEAIKRPSRGHQVTAMSVPNMTYMKRGA
jgi:hypothetical protein